ncbi:MULTISPECIES: hypothetical protein [unclassified Mesorhizobium]|uniref:hypothetical protein n=1 Tax=unclassified Mesorhizobium TaxID=325217 RepID=UPI00112E6175|nr:MULTISPECIES: hypothetical protein [unclassified Mesorhizobium]MCA0025476.1 hypothetical protein [Mesorhizobium sp. B263B1A]TPJ97136.1 hypothetical protein FJ489_11905 [Mesorhizobium sp. B2-5-12]TPK27197.1 hypothetical protein FJ562_08120 [Mesorhizobium sp. B2-5-6]
MTDLVITAANVVAGANAETETGAAGEAITAGQPVYRSSTTKKLMKAHSNGASAEIRTPIGVALNGGAVDQPIKVQKGGDVTIGATLTPGVAYYLSDTPGGICPVADIGTGEYVCLIGLAKSASVLALDIRYTGVAN